jgi:hypothetical protein
MNTIIRLLILLLVCITQIQAGNNHPQALAHSNKSQNTKDDCSLSNPDSVVNIKVYPNPTSEYIRVEGTKEGAELLLYNDSGKLLMTLVATQNYSQISIRDLAKGIYHLRYRSKSAKFTDKTILIS